MKTAGVVEAPPGGGEKRRGADLCEHQRPPPNLGRSQCRIPGDFTSRAESDRDCEPGRSSPIHAGPCSGTRKEGGCSCAPCRCGCGGGCRGLPPTCGGLRCRRRQQWRKLRCNFGHSCPSTTPRKRRQHSEGGRGRRHWNRHPVSLIPPSPGDPSGAPSTPSLGEPDRPRRRRDPPLAGPALGRYAPIARGRRQARVRRREDGSKGVE